MNMSLQTQFLTTSAGRLAYDSAGEGPLVVCLAGLGDTRATWRHLRPLLVETGHRVVTMDLRGAGETSAVWDDYSPEAIGADLLALLAHLDAGPATLITNSYTGATAVWAAATSPSSFSALVLCDPFARVMPPPNALMKLAMAAVGRFRPLWSMYWTSLYKTRKPADFAASRAALVRSLGEPGRMAALRAMFAADVSVCEARFPDVRTPALVVMGSKDPDFPAPADEAALIAGRLGGTVAMIDGAGHYPQTEYPAETFAAIQAFLEAQCREQA